jgi:glycine cleavage system H protein
MHKNFQGHMWYLKEDNVYTVGINEDALETFEEITSLELPTENEVVDNDASCGNMETDTEPLEIFTPVSGTVIEVNSTVLEDPTLIQDDPYDSWLFKVESDEEIADDDEDEEDDEDEDDEDDLDDEDDEDEEEEDED